MPINQYGGINDFPNCEHRIYNLWYQMLRRCYDKTQLSRPRGKSYSDCSVSENWKLLSNFAKDIKTLKGYSNWADSKEYCLDKDMKVKGNRIYGKEFCQFVTKRENIRYISILNPNNTDALGKAKLTKYKLFKNGEYLTFESEKSACKYLGVRQCSVCSCYRRGCKCKGYKIERVKMDKEQ